MGLCSARDSYFKTESNVLVQVKDLCIRVEPSPENLNKYETNTSGLITNHSDLELGVGNTKVYDLRDSTCMFKSLIYFYYFLSSVVCHTCLVIGFL